MHVHVPLRSSSNSMILSNSLNTKLFSSSLLSLADSLVRSMSIFLPPEDSMSSSEETEDTETLTINPSCR